MKFYKNNFKLEILDIKYNFYKSKETGKDTTVCILLCSCVGPGASKENPSRAKRHTHHFLSRGLFTDGTFKVVTKAVLGEGEVSNKEIGMKVAKAKAEIKAYEQAAKMVWNNFQYFEDQLLNALRTFENKAQKVKSGNERYIKNLFK